MGAEPTTYGEWLADRVREIASDGVDAALDVGGRRFARWWSCLPPRARVIRIADYAGARQTARGRAADRAPPACCTPYETFIQLIESDRFSLPVAQTFLLETIGDPEALSQQGQVRGELVLLAAEHPIDSREKPNC